MARRINKTVVGILAVLAMIVVVTVGVVVVSSLPGRDPARYIAEAEKAEAAGEFDRATKLYWRAHQADSTKNPDLVVRAGRAALEDDQAETPVAGALYFIDQALVMNPSLESALEFQTDTSLIGAGPYRVYPVQDLARIRCDLIHNPGGLTFR